MEHWRAWLDWIPFGATLGGAVLSLVVARRFAQDERGRSGFRGQAIMAGLSVAALIAVTAALPVSDTLRGELLALLGVVLSATIALSSTSIVGNALAGLMLRAVRNFRPGDFVRVCEHEGRVTQIGLVHTEIQTEDSSLTTLPNLYLVANPVNVLRDSGTLIAAEVSLGYDVPRHSIQEALLAAAEAAGLEEGFVHLLDLGDFSVTWRISGMLRDVRTLISARSRLRAAVLDSLHAAQIEIVSPTYMTTRALAPDHRVLPPHSHEPVPESPSVEPLAFDKAEEAASTEQLKDRIAEVQEALHRLAERVDASPRGDVTELPTLEAREARLQETLTHLKTVLKARE